MNHHILMGIIFIIPLFLLLFIVPVYADATFPDRLVNITADVRYADGSFVTGITGTATAISSDTFSVRYNLPEGSNILNAIINFQFASDNQEAQKPINNLSFNFKYSAAVTTNGTKRVSSFLKSGTDISESSDAYYNAYNTWHNFKLNGEGQNWQHLCLVLYGDQSSDLYVSRGNTSFTVYFDDFVFNDSSTLAVEEIVNSINSSTERIIQSEEATQEKIQEVIDYDTDEHLSLPEVPDYIDFGVSDPDVNVINRVGDNFFVFCIGQTVNLCKANTYLYFFLWLSLMLILMPVLIHWLKRA